MKILAIDSSAVSASAAASEDAQVLACAFQNNGLTHSQTLLPMVEQVLSEAKLSLADIDLFAVTNGPGSFTGVRIGVCAMKGMAFCGDKPCIGISTLELIAAGVKEKECIVIACMDARRSQVYTASFETISLKRLTPDEAVSVESLVPRIRSYHQKVILAGDGASMAYEILKHQCDNVYLAEGEQLYQNAKELCALAYQYRAKAQNGSLLVPTYLRMSQAERELSLKNSKGESV